MENGRRADGAAAAVQETGQHQGSCGIDRFFSHLNLTQATQPSAHSARNSCTLPVTLAAAEQRSSRICPRGCAQPGHELSLTAVPCWVGWGLSGLSQIEVRKETINATRPLITSTYFGGVFLSTAALLLTPFHSGEARHGTADWLTDSDWLTGDCRLFMGLEAERI